MSRTVVIVEDDPTLRLGLRRVLESRGGFLVHEFGRAEEALASLDEIPTDVILTDLQMPGMGGLAFIEELSSRFPELPVVVVSGVPDLEVAARAVEAGATDFLQKPIGAQRVLVTVQNVLRLEALRRRTSLLERETRGGGTLIGDSPVMQRLRVLIDKVAPTEGRVLILGENGTGKELVANAIHRGSSRADGPMVKLNCAAVPSELVESELFGHEKGAFTGAARARRGRFEEASGGTLFLDDIDDMPLPTQVKLLRALQEREFERVGGEIAVRVDIRVVVATKVDLRELVAEGRFRDDLYWRIHVVPVLLPALRERAGDVPLLVQHLLERHGGGRAHTVPRSTMALLERYPWPGNVRELENAVQRAIALCGSDGVLASDDLLPADPRWRGAAHVPQAIRPLRDVLREHEREHLAHALEWTGGHRQQTAELLGISRKVLWEKLKDHGLGREEEA